MKKQTAVQWLVDELKDNGIDYDITEIVQQALEMEKANTCNFAVEWFKNCPIGGDVQDIEQVKQYYKTTNEE